VIGFVILRRPGGMNEADHDYFTPFDIGEITLIIMGNEISGDTHSLGQPFFRNRPLLG
jgi:hypothetical protein